MMSLMATRQPKPVARFEERLAKEAARFRARAQSLPPGSERDNLLSLANQCETAAKIHTWVTSRGVRPPEVLPSLRGRPPR
jgi:hypothetical protein